MCSAGSIQGWEEIEEISTVVWQQNLLGKVVDLGALSCDFTYICCMHNYMQDVVFGQHISHPDISHSLDNKSSLESKII